MSKRKLTEFFQKKQKKEEEDLPLPPEPEPTTSSTEESQPALNDDVSQFPYRPPKTFVFQKTIIGSRARSSQHLYSFCILIK